MSHVIIGRQDLMRICGICHRTLLTGERPTRFSPGRDEWVDVCPLCVETANEHGWIREGSPTTPLVSYPGRRRKRFHGFAGLLEGRRAEPEVHVGEPVLRRLSVPEQAMVEAAEIFNASPYRRTVGGIAKSLGEPRVSFLALSGVNPEVVLTIAWDISWYQYRVGLDPQGVKLAERGYELDELEDRFAGWNGYLEEDGRVTPDIPRL